MWPKCSSFRIPNTRAAKTRVAQTDLPTRPQIEPHCSVEQGYWGCCLTSLSCLAIVRPFSGVNFWGLDSESENSTGNIFCSDVPSIFILASKTVPPRVSSKGTYDVFLPCNLHRMGNCYVYSVCVHHINRYGPNHGDSSVTCSEDVGAPCLSPPSTPCSCTFIYLLILMSKSGGQLKWICWTQTVHQLETYTNIT